MSTAKKSAPKKAAAPEKKAAAPRKAAAPKKAAAPATPELESLDTLVTHMVGQVDAWLEGWTDGKHPVSRNEMLKITRKSIMDTVSAGHVDTDLKGKELHAFLTRELEINDKK